METETFFLGGGYDKKSRFSKKEKKTLILEKPSIATPTWNKHLF